MGRIKIPFPNGSDLYLHDTPNKDLFAQDDRMLSHGCIRLQDAERLGRWLMGRDPQAASGDPEQNVLLPTPVPIYVTYLTAQVNNGQISFVDDIYGRDYAGRGAPLRSAPPTGVPIWRGAVVLKWSPMKLRPKLRPSS